MVIDSINCKSGVAEKLVNEGIGCSGIIGISCYIG